MGCIVDFSVSNRQIDDVACNGLRGAPEEQGRGIQEYVVAEEVISAVDEEVFVAVRQHGRMGTEKGLWLACESAGDSTGGRAHSSTAKLCFFFFLDSLMSALFLSLRGRSHHIGTKSDVTVWDPGL